MTDWELWFRKAWKFWDDDLGLLTRPFTIFESFVFLGSVAEFLITNSLSAFIETLWKGTVFALAGVLVIIVLVNLWT